MLLVTISLAAHPLELGTWLVVAWLSAIDNAGQERTRGLVEEWVGTSREGLARITAEALGELKRPSEVVVAMRKPDLSEAPPSSETAAALTNAAARHQVSYKVIPREGLDRAVEAAERFARARAAGATRTPRPVEPAAPTSPPPIPRKLF